MSLIRGHALAYKYETQDCPVFENVTFSIDRMDKIGLIGGNGCGKTTLIRLLSGECEATAGSIDCPHTVVVGVLPQKLQLPERVSVGEFLWSSRPRLQAMRQQLSAVTDFTSSGSLDLLSDYEGQGGYTFEFRFERAIVDFGFSPVFLDRDIATLSGGEKTKIALARLILAEPGMLLLDEPTNHLDVQTLSWLEGYLDAIRLPMILVSHDRRFLDSCVSRIWELTREGLRVFHGNYSAYKRQKEEELVRNLELYENQQRKIRQLQKTARDRRQWAYTYQAETRAEGYAPVFESVINKAKKAMKRAKTVEHRIERMIEREEAAKPWLEKQRNIIFSPETIKNRFVLNVDRLTKHFDDLALFDDLSISVEQGVRLAVVGPNGSGKTTLMKMLAGYEPPTAGAIAWAPQVRIGYYAQELENVNVQATILQEVLNGRRDVTDETQARTILGSLGLIKDKVHQRISTLSFGERSKVALARILCSGANVLLLDEPTNHLEIAAREMIECALERFGGTLLFVSHDRWFVDRFATARLELAAGVGGERTHVYYCPR